MEQLLIGLLLHFRPTSRQRFATAVQDLLLQYL
jgi:hypothetical protein